MTTRTYVNFDLLIEKEQDGSYEALVTGSPVGTASSVRFHLPFDSTTLENLLLKLDPGRSGVRRAGGDTQQQAAMDFGGPLYQAIFRDDVLLAWSRSQDRAREQGDGLRLRLRLREAAEIAGLPWELLYDRPNNTFLAQSERTPMVRYLDIPAVPRAIRVDGPLHVLAIISSPLDLEALDVEAEWYRLREAMKDRIEAGSMVLDRLPKATVSELGPWLRRHPTHVIHFVGHGDFDERLREGVVYFQNASGGSAAVTSSVLGPYVRDHDPLRLVVLNACRSARTDALDPFGGIAQGLVQQDATAVVAMQFPISDRAAVAFTGDFYGCLVDGVPVDQAVTSARKALLGEFRDEWATPVLFLRAPDGVIFEDVHASTRKRHDRWWRFERPGRRVLLGGVAAAVTLVVIAAVALLATRDGDSWTPAVVPVAAVPLSPDELLVAAGSAPATLNVYRVDLAAGTATAVTVGTGRKAGPSIGADRDTLIYAARVTGTSNRALRVVDPSTGESDGPLLEDVPAECAQSMERPALSPTNDDVIISACKDASSRYSLVELNLATGATRVLDGSGMRVGEPTISRDGERVVYWANGLSTATGGHLYMLDLTDPGAARVQVTFGTWEDGDAVFSPVDDRTIAFRRRTPDGDDIFTRSVDDLEARARPLVAVPASDQEPSFSPEGKRLAFQRTTETGTRVYVVDLLAPDAAPVPIPAPTDEPYQMVPSWSRR